MGNMGNAQMMDPAFEAYNSGAINLKTDTSKTMSGPNIYS